jgi:hypothetical protein
MDKVHEATRPGWAVRKIEPLGILLFALFFSSAASTFFSGWIKARIAPHLESRDISEQSATYIADGGITLALTGIGWVLLPIYKLVKTRRYPGTYVYVFEKIDRVQDKLGNIKEQKVYVVGGLVLRCLENGGISAEGHAYDWRASAPDISTKMRWRSQNVGTTEESGRATCYIIYEVDQLDRDKRPYHSGLLSFEKQSKEKGIIPPHQTVYRGHIHAIDPPNGTVPFYAYAYAERIGREMSEPEIMNRLRDYGEALIIRRGQQR